MPVGGMGLGIKKTGNKSTGSLNFRSKNVKHKKYVYTEQLLRARVQMATKLGDKIRRLRKSAGMTLEELGTQSGASKAYIWELENRTPPRPSAEKLTAIARVLGVTPEYLLDEAQDEPSDAVANSAFFRRYEGLPEETKQKVRQIVDLLTAEPKK